MSTSVANSQQAEVTVDTATIEVITGIAAGVVSPMHRPGRTSSGPRPTRVSGRRTTAATTAA